MVAEHLVEVGPLDVKELRDEERPVEAELGHVEEPDPVSQVVVGVAVPAVRDGPEPLLVPEDQPAAGVHGGVEQGFPSGLAELVQLGRLAEQGSGITIKSKVLILHLELDWRLVTFA